MKRFLAKNKIRIVLAIPIIVILAFLWLWFYETVNIQIEHHSVETGFTSKFVLVSDMHLGLFKKEAYLADVVAKINTQESIEFIAITGDFIFANLPVQNQAFYDKLFEPLKDLKYPVLATFGNHENGASDPDITELLKSTLTKYNVQIIEEREVTINGKRIVGLYDSWGSSDAYKYLETVQQPIDIVLTHNPDVVLDYTKSVGITLAGHTHCGQLRIPFVYKYVLPIKSEYEKGLYTTAHGKVFVTCGLGETGPPFRLWNRPTIDIIETR